MTSAQARDGPFDVVFAGAAEWAEATLAVTMSPVPASRPTPRPSTVAWRSHRPPL